MLTTLIAAAALAQPATAITGTATYRERMVLPPGSRLRLSLDRFSTGNHESITEVVMKLNGRQVPIAFSIPYSLPQRAAGETFGVRADFLDESGRALFSTPSHAKVITNGRTRVALVLTKADVLPAPALLGTRWELVEAMGKKPSSGRKPHITFDKNGKNFGGFTGVNQFGGEFEHKAPSITINPGAMTMMAGTPAQMEVERALVDALSQATKVEILEGQMSLLRGEKVLAVFRPARAS